MAKILRDTERPPSDASVMLMTGIQLGDAKKVGDIPYAVVPDGCSIQSLEKFLPSPTRIRQQIQFDGVHSFCDYVKKFGTVEQAFILADNIALNAVAIIDYHLGRSIAQREEPGWGDHVAILQLSMSPEWLLWTNSDKKVFGQEEFAEFIEDNRIDIASPPGAEMLEMAQDIEARKAVEFRSSVRLQDGSTRLNFPEQSAQGDMKLPSEFILGIAPFEHGEAYKMTARLRYRINGSKLTFSYHLDRPQDIIDEAFAKTLSIINEKTGFKPLLGRKIK